MCNSKCVGLRVDGCVDSDIVAEKFAEHFSAAYTPNNVLRANQIFQKYLLKRTSYCGLPITEEHEIDTELVSSILSRLHCGKAPDVVGLTAEHLVNSHPSISVVLCKLFKIIMNCRCVPSGFKHGYLVPIPKMRYLRGKSLSCDDFRGIAISPIISKVFEHCILDRFQTFFLSCNSQFGFKKGYRL